METTKFKECKLCSPACSACLAWFLRGTNKTRTNYFILSFLNMSLVLTCKCRAQRSRDDQDTSRKSVLLHRGVASCSLLPLPTPARMQRASSRAHATVRAARSVYFDGIWLKRIYKPGPSGCGLSRRGSDDYHLIAVSVPLELSREVSQPRQVYGNRHRLIRLARTDPSDRDGNVWCFRK